MNTNRKTAIFVGALFLIAMFTSLPGGILLESIISAPDYLISMSENVTEVKIGVFLEFMNGLSVIGIGVLMFPIFKKHNEGMALGYAGFRIIEAVFYIGGAIIPLSLITLSQEFAQASTANAAYFQIVGDSYIAERAQLAGLLVPVFMGLGALLFYYLLYQSKLLPRFISVWGFIGAVLMLTANLLAVGASIMMIFVLPLILNEIFLAGWLIVKRFNPDALAFNEESSS